MNLKQVNHKILNMDLKVVSDNILKFLKHQDVQKLLLQSIKWMISLFNGLKKYLILELNKSKHLLKDFIETILLI